MDHIFDTRCLPTQTPACRCAQELTLVGSIAYVDSLSLFAQLPAQLTLISISTEFVLRRGAPIYSLTLLLP